MKPWLISICLLAFWVSSLSGQEQPGFNPGILEESWQAHWITCPDIDEQEYGVYLFRRDFSFDSLPGSLKARILRNTHCISGIIFPSFLKKPD